MVNILPIFLVLISEFPVSLPTLFIDKSSPNSKIVSPTIKTKLPNRKRKISTQGIAFPCGEITKISWITKTIAITGSTLITISFNLFSKILNFITPFYS